MIAMTIFIAHLASLFLASPLYLLPRSSGWRLSGPSCRKNAHPQDHVRDFLRCIPRAADSAAPVPRHTLPSRPIYGDNAGLRLPWRNEPMINASTIDEVARRLAELVPPDARAARDDLVANFRDALRGGLRKLDLVTREEFDAQRGVLLRTRETVEALEARIAELEERLGGR
jgi:BMFP domain-containing protein YqiC